jgi:DNA-directed RNA polymerase specialized sigma subunit
MNAQVSAYVEACEALAAEVARSGRARRVRAEFDDLFQEGMIFVWQTLEKGEKPSAEMIRNRMRNWIRTLAGQSPARYDELLPLDENRADEG